MIKGDAGIQDIYKWGQPGMYTSPLSGPTPGTTISAGQRGASGAGDGVHVLTGPIYVNGAVPGDVIKVDILDLRPRVNPTTGKTFGINAAAWWGCVYCPSCHSPCCHDSTLACLHKAASGVPLRGFG